MNRLTTRLYDNVISLNNVNELNLDNEIAKAMQKLAAYEDTGLEPEDIEKALELLDLEEQGRLIKLPPIKKDDTLYWIWGDKIMPVKLEEIDTGVTYKMTTKEDRTFTKINGGKFTYEKGNVRFFYSDDFGKTVFLTQEEAEKALEAVNGNIGS